MKMDLQNQREGLVYAGSPSASGAFGRISSWVEREEGNRTYSTASMTGEFTGSRLPVWLKKKIRQPVLVRHFIPEVPETSDNRGLRIYTTLDPRGAEYQGSQHLGDPGPYH